MLDHGFNVMLFSFYVRAYFGMGTYCLRDWYNCDCCIAT